jgi:hypothetical protein
VKSSQGCPADPWRRRRDWTEACALPLTIRHCLGGSVWILLSALSNRTAGIAATRARRPWLTSIGGPGSAGWNRRTSRAWTLDWDVDPRRGCIDDDHRAPDPGLTLQRLLSNPAPKPIGPGFRSALALESLRYCFPFSLSIPPGTGGSTGGHGSVRACRSPALGARPEEPHHPRCAAGEGIGELISGMRQEKTGGWPPSGLRRKAPANINLMPRKPGNQIDSQPVAKTPTTLPKDSHAKKSHLCCLYSHEASNLCDRRQGIGCDGWRPGSPSNLCLRLSWQPRNFRS